MPVRRAEERTLQAALDWSYGLLKEDERNLLRCLAVFPAEFTLEAAKETCADDATRMTSRWPTGWPNELRTASISPAARLFVHGYSRILPRISWTSTRVAQMNAWDCNQPREGHRTLGTLTCIHKRLDIGWLTGAFPHAAAMVAALDDLPDGPTRRSMRVVVEIQAAACAGDWEQVIDASREHKDLDEHASVDMLCFRAEALGAPGRIDNAIVALDQVDKPLGGKNVGRSSSQIISA